MPNIDSPEHRAALAARREQGARGAHIRETPSHHPPTTYEVAPIDPPADAQALSVQVDALTNLVRKSLASKGEPDMSIPKPRFDGTINTGNILTIIILLVGFAGAWGAYTADKATRDARIDTLLDRLVHDEKTSDDLRKQYIPLIDEARRANDNEDNRIQALSLNLGQLRDIVTDLTKVTAQTDKTLAVWIAQHEKTGGG